MLSVIFAVLHLRSEEHTSELHSRFSFPTRRSSDLSREVIPERRMHAKGSGAFGTFTVTNDVTKYTKAKVFSEVGKQTEMFARFSEVAAERGGADAERDIRGFAL